MRSIARHIIFFLILFFAFNVKAYNEEISSSMNHTEEDCECFALSETNILENEEDECTSSCCVMQREEDMYFSPVPYSTKEVNFSGILIIERKKNNANSSCSFLIYRLTPFRVTKTSFPFLQVILA